MYHELSVDGRNAASRLVLLVFCSKIVNLEAIALKHAVIPLSK